MKKILISIAILLSLIFSSWGFLYFGTGIWYKDYVKWWEYRRLHPDLVPSPILIKAFDMGHTSSYASFTWLSLIQYIADNVAGNEFLGFSHTILNQITTLHPYFVRPYEIDLILSPLSRWENLDPKEGIKNIEYTKKAIELGKKWIDQLCDKEKIEKIKKRNISENPMNDPSLRNPCASGMLPYYVAFAIYQMGDNKSEASLYYQIASMNDDGPTASQLLGILALSGEWDYMASAMNFALVWSSGYDVEPYTCHDFTRSLLQYINKKELPLSTIRDLDKKANSLKDTRDPKNPLSRTNDNCYDMANRSIKELYLGHISKVASGSTAENGKDLIKLWLFKTLPLPISMDGFTVVKKDNHWEYRQLVK